MILYLDASALVKRYVSERGSSGVARAVAAAEVCGTSIISRAETSAALAKAAHMAVLGHKAAARATQRFRDDWPDLVRVRASEAVVARADRLCWSRDLRGYDAVQLASSLVWSDGLGTPVTFATFDRALWTAARAEGLPAFPADLPGLLDAWRRD